MSSRILPYIFCPITAKTGVTHGTINGSGYKRMTVILPNGVKYGGDAVDQYGRTLIAMMARWKNQLQIPGYFMIPDTYTDIEIAF